MRVILASQSPRRRELLKVIFDDFEIIPSSCEEVVPSDIAVQNVAEFLADLKANDIAKKYPEALVIGADTVVIAENEILGKPKNEAQAKEMLNKLSGEKHKVITGVSLYFNGKNRSFSEITEVEFFDLSNDEIENYVKTHEPMDKAGAYGIQGKGSLLVKRINGDYFNVVGLPIARLKREIDEFLK